MNDLKKKSVMLIISSIMLVSTLLYLSFAWYTKMTSVAGLTFKTAKWDVSANYQLDSFKVNVYKYNTIGAEQYAAPGVWGFIPIQMTASGANTDVSYTITVDKSTLSKEFQNRLYFYYYTGTDTPPAIYILPAKSNLKELISSGADKTSIIGTVSYGASDPGLACIYWHWVYDYAEWLEINDPDQSDVVEIFNKLEAANPGNVDILCTYENEALAFKTTGIVPAEKYYVKSETPVRIEYDMSNWDSEVIKPELYSDANLGSIPITGEPDTSGNTTYYCETYYPPYVDNGVTPRPTVYVKDGNKYKEAIFHYDNELFQKIYSDGTTEYYALTPAEIENLVAFRTKMMGLPDTVYTNQYTFFNDFYESYCNARDEFDNFDTKVGENPNAYIEQMNATVLVTGEHVTPEQDD